MGFLKRHWSAIVGAVSNLPTVWHGLVWLFDWGARIDLVATKLHEHGGIGAVAAFFLSPPPWLIFITLPLGLCLIWWDLRGRPRPMWWWASQTRLSEATPASDEVKHILIQDAARMAFERAEDLGILDLVSSVHSNPHDKAEYFIFAFLSDERIQVFGKRVPSSILRLIPHDELKHLRPVPGKSCLRSDFASSPNVFEDVSITKADLDEYLMRLSGLRELGTQRI